MCLGGKIDFCDFLWLLIAYRSFQKLPAPHAIIRYELYLQEEDLCAHICFCPHPSLSCCTALPFYSLPPSLPRCRLNLFLFIVSSSSSGAGLWVSMLRGRRRSCLCCVVHYNLLYVLKRRKKGPCHVMNKRRKVCGPFVFCLWTNTFLNCFCSCFCCIMHCCPCTIANCICQIAGCQCVDVDRRKGLGRAQSRSAGNSLLLTVPPTDIGLQNTKSAQYGFKNIT